MARLGPLCRIWLPASDPRPRRRSVVRSWWHSRLVGLHSLQRGGYGLLGRVGFYIALAAVASRILGAVVYLAGSSALEWISWPSTLGMLVGFVLYGSATLQARVMPRWYGLVLLASMPIALPLEVYWTALFGMILVVLAYVLWLRNDTTTEQPSRVR